ncbi:hypothetical protein GIB67_022303 [Kingdonia uniflora]|uniref:Uncharacterized protein n=1 Tax=Kingdonia uniflora TaxID=39325 RepID=A0A7J7KW26_9MAGN|nr:hypothetical protein GIB67_022303 [Kingdonia uniflora]
MIYVLQVKGYPPPKILVQGYPETNGRGLDLHRFGPLVANDDVPQSNDSFKTISTDVPPSNEPSIPQSNIHLSNEPVLTNILLSNESMLTNVPLSIEPKLIIGQNEPSAEFQFEPQPEQVKDLVNFWFKSVAYIEDPYDINKELNIGDLYRDMIELKNHIRAYTVVNKFNFEYVLSNEYKIVVRYKDLSSPSRLVHSRNWYSLGRLIYGLIGLRGIHVRFDIAFECSTRARRLQVAYYIRPLSARVSEIGIEAFPEKNCWLLEFEWLTDAYWVSKEARDLRIREKTLELKQRYFGYRGLDWVMPDFSELELGEHICGMSYAYWKRVHQMMGPFPSDRFALLESLAEEVVDKDDTEIRTRRSLRLRLIDEEIEENDPSVSGRALVDESNDLEELEITTDAPLTVVVPEVAASSKSYRKARVTEERNGEMVRGERNGPEGSVEPSGDEREDGGQSVDSESSTDLGEAAGLVSAKEKLRLDRFAAKLELSKVGVVLYAMGSRYTFKSQPQEGFMAFRGQIWLGMQLPLRRLVKEVLNFWEVALCQMNEIFYEMIRVVKGMNVELRCEGRGLIEWYDIVSFYSRKANQKGQQVPKQAGPVHEVARDASRQASKQTLAQVDKGMGKVFPESLKVHQPKGPQWKRRKVLGEDHAEDVDKELIEAELEDQARAMATSMATLCGTDLDRA